MASPTQPDNSAWPPPEFADWTPSDPKAVEEQLKKEFTDKQRADAWDKAATAVKIHHDELVKQWQDAMDSILVYAGLFSAVLTAFNVLAYPLLQRDPTDPTLAALQQISAQLNSFSVNPSFINSTQPVLSPDQLRPPFHASASAVWINTLWFASLVCSLAAASIALMVKQWLFEESKGLSGTSREVARIRQYRLNSLIKWSVGAIILVPSVLLQVALFLFLAGLLVLLWTIHETVAAVITTLAGALFIFVAFVTILPIFKSDCCYRSPQASGALVVVKLFWNKPINLAMASLWSLFRTIHLFEGGLRGWFRDLCYICHELIEKIPLVSTWNGSEQAEVARDHGVLDRHIAAMAYTTTFATKHLQTHLPILISDLPCDQMFSCFSDIHRSWIDLWGPKNATGHFGRLAKLLLGKPFHCALRKLLTIDPDERASVLGGDWMGLSSEYLLSSYNAQEFLPLSTELMSTLARLSIGDSTFTRKTSGLLYHSFYLHLDLEPISSPITYDTLRDIMAVATYNTTMAKDWAASRPNRDDIVDILKAVPLSFKVAKLVLINSVGLPEDQESWIRSQSRSILSSLVEKMTGVKDIRIWKIFTEIVGELIETYTQIARGYEVVPEGFLDIRMPSEVPGDHWTRPLVTLYLARLERVIPQQRNAEL